MIFEEKLIFFPSRFPIGDWRPEDLVFEDVYFQAEDGTQLHGWYVPHPHPRAHVLYCHGNAGNITCRAQVLKHLNEQLGLSVFVFDYRGYGRSEGKPTERGVLSDAQAASGWLAERAGVDPRQLVLLGRSLGGPVAVDVAADHGARGLILESTFPSLPDVAAKIYPWLPVRLLLRTRLDAAKKIRAYDGPVLQSHGDSDGLVPIGLGKQLHQEIPGPKRFVTIPDADHNSPQGWDYYRELDQFVERL